MADLAQRIAWRKTQLQGGVISHTLMIIAQPDHHLEWRRLLAIGLGRQYGCRSVVVGDCYYIAVVGRETHLRAVIEDYQYIASEVKLKAYQSWRSHQLAIFRERKRRVRWRQPQSGVRVANQSAWQDAYIAGALETLLAAKPLEMDPLVVEAVEVFYPKVAEVPYGKISGSNL